MLGCLLHQHEWFRRAIVDVASKETFVSFEHQIDLFSYDWLSLYALNARTHFELVICDWLGLAPLLNYFSERTDSVHVLLKRIYHFLFAFKQLFKRAILDCTYFCSVFFVDLVYFIKCRLVKFLKYFESLALIQLVSLSYIFWNGIILRTCLIKRANS